jgi:hypothetical protein
MLPGFFGKDELGVNVGHIDALTSEKCPESKSKKLFIPSIE